MRIDTSIAVLVLPSAAAESIKISGPKDTNLTGDRPTVGADLSRPRQERNGAYIKRRDEGATLTSLRDRAPAITIENRPHPPAARFG